MLRHPLLGPQLKAYSIYGVQPPHRFLASNFYLHSNVRLPKIPLCVPAAFLGVSAFHFMWLRFTKDFKVKTTKCQGPFSVPPFFSGTFASGILADNRSPTLQVLFPQTDKAAGSGDASMNLSASFSAPRVTRCQEEKSSFSESPFPLVSSRAP